MFSPFYAHARRRGRADPLEHCALNVSLYSPAGKHWTFTERRRKAVQRTASTLQLGPSALAWDGNTLEVRIDEVTAPLPLRVRGLVRLHAPALRAEEYLLDRQGLHRWRPLAACARVEVLLEAPALRWTGDGYLDANHGDEPLEDAFASWQWTRTVARDRCVVLYDVEERSGEEVSLALLMDAAAGSTRLEPPPRVALPPSAWRLPRTLRAEAAARVIRTVEDGPFYARSIVGLQLAGESLIAFHESLSLDRFRRPWVRLLLPFRMRAHR